MKTIHFSQPKTTFSADLRKSVNDYFNQKNLNQTGTFPLFFKSGILLTAYILLIAFPYFVSIPLVAYCLVQFFVGINQALIGFNVMHDACHDSFSSNKKVNYIFGLSINLLGSDAFLWKQKHNVVHHTYTNIEGADDDIAKSPLLRMTPDQPKYKAHRFQHIYMFFLYSISTIFWVVFKDFQTYFTTRYKVNVNKMTVVDHLIFWSAKALYFFVFLYLPISQFGFSTFILGFVLMHVALGLSLSIVFQLAHVVEHVEFEDATKLSTTTIEEEWTVHQLKTTSDFATKNPILTWLLGGLNYQVIHHLFPRISHIHYPALQSIVAEVCERHGVKYHNVPKFGQAIKAHVRHMKNLGQA